MTNKVKPFYIKITDDMTPQIVQDAFDKCVDAGAVPFDCVLDCDARYRYQSEYELNFVCFGVDFEGDTYLSDEHGRYGKDSQEITLDQLDEWLGLEVEKEWKNGDECIKDGAKYIYVSKHPLRNSSSICVHAGNGLTYTLITGKLSKPETPEQKAERERLESGRELWLKYQQALADVGILPGGKNKAWDSNLLSKDEMESWCILAENVTWVK